LKDIKILLCIIAIGLVGINYHLYIGDVISTAQAGKDCGNTRYNACFVKIINK